MIACHIARRFRLLLPVLILVSSVIVPAAAGELQHIEAMRSSGAIDESTALRWKILWLKRPDLLPKPVRDSGPSIMRCATPVVLEIIRGFDRLSPADRAWLAEKAGIRDLAGVFERPPFNHTIQSSVRPLRVHYETPDQESIAMMTLQVYEASWQRECDEIGFFPPPPDYGVEGSDDLDVYISDQVPSGAWGYTGHDQAVAETWWYDWTSYIVHSSELTTHYTIAMTGSHEFNHACQAAMAADEPAAIWENTAQWAIPHVYPEYGPQARASTSGFQADPWRAVSDYVNGGLYQYGGMMWPEYLEDRFNGWEPDLVRDVWDWCRDGPGDGYDHDYFSAFAHFAELHEPGGPGGTGWTIEDVLMDFSAWRWFCGAELDDGQHFTHGAGFAPVTIEPSQVHTALPAASPSPLPAPPQLFGVNYVRLDEALTGAGPLTLFLHTEPKHFSSDLRWKVGVLSQTLGGSSTCTVHDVPGDSDCLWLEIDPGADIERLALVVGNMATATTGPGSNYATRDYGYIVWPDPDPPRSALFAAPGPGPANAPVVRGVLTADTTVECCLRSHDPAASFGLRLAAGDVDGDGVEELICGSGPDPSAAPLFRAYEVNGRPVTGAEAVAYGASAYGVNVAAGDIDGDGFDEIVTGAGPGAIFGPHVRGWNLDGGDAEAMTEVNFLAYGTPKYGVNVAAGDIDGDGFDEIVTGAGPGAVFGPHVRAWNVDGGEVNAVPGVSFFAYGTPRWGVNVAVADVDGDGIDDIITGAGPGTVYGPHVRGWSFDGTAITPIPGLSFMAYGTLQYGVNVAAGDLDEDGRAEILTGPGPGPSFGAHVRGFDYDAAGGTVQAMPRISFFAFSPEGGEADGYGCTVAAVDLDA